MTEEEAQDQRVVEHFEKILTIRAVEWLRSRGFSEHPLLDNEEIEIVLVSAFKAGARWGGDHPCGGF